VNIPAAAMPSRTTPPTASRAPSPRRLRPLGRLGDRPGRLGGGSATGWAGWAAVGDGLGGLGARATGWAGWAARATGWRPGDGRYPGPGDGPNGAMGWVSVSSIRLSRGGSGMAVVSLAVARVRIDPLLGRARQPSRDTAQP